ncbi:MAG: hypothetical protein EOP33_05315 [Rickettsiaceae bacterium]|nr:MAG: hypothetical protein EOP33_05315 [Rickettsiaceae bacterium]
MMIVSQLAFVLGFTTIFGYINFCRNLLKIDFGHATVFTFSIILSIYFIASITYTLDLVIYGSFILGTFLFLKYLYDFFITAKSRQNFSYDYTDHIIFALIIIVFYYNIRWLPVYAFWDEYSYWGVALKEMNIYHGFQKLEQPKTVNASYVPLSTIFQYSISKLIGFKEAHNVFANGLIGIIFSSVFFTPKKIYLSLTFILIAILPALFFDIISLNSLHIDTNLGIVFGACIAIYVQSKKYNNPYLTFFLTAPILFILPNIKEAGYWLAYIVIALLFSDKILRKKYCKMIILLALLPIIGKCLWVYHLYKVNQLAFPPFSQIPGSSVIRLIMMIRNQEDFGLLYIVIKKILPYFYSYMMIINYAIFTLGIIFLRIYDLDNWKKLIYYQTLLLLGFILYIIFRLELYLSPLVFLKQEALNAASHERYLSSYSMVFSFCSLSFIKNALDRNVATNINIKIFCLAPKNIFIILSVILNVLSLKQINYQLRIPNPAYFIERKNLIQNLIDNSQNKEIDFRGYNMLDCYIYRYMEAPYLDKKKVEKCLHDIKQ